MTPNDLIELSFTERTLSKKGIVITQVRVSPEDHQWISAMAKAMCIYLIDGGVDDGKLFYNGIEITI